MDQNHKVDKGGAKRIGKHIATFTSLYTERPVRLIYQHDITSRTKHLEMPPRQLKLLQEELKATLQTHVDVPPTSDEGWYEAHKIAALYIVSLTGCRPCEAAYIVWYKYLRKNNLRKPGDWPPHLEFESYSATVPDTMTKTKHTYTFYLHESPGKLLRDFMNKSEAPKTIGSAGTLGISLSYRLQKYLE